MYTQSPLLKLNHKLLSQETESLSDTLSVEKKIFLEKLA